MKGDIADGAVRRQQKRGRVKHFTYGQRVRMDALVRVKWPRGKKVNFAELGRLAGARFLQVLNGTSFGMRTGRGKGETVSPLLVDAAHAVAARKASITSLGVFQPRHLRGRSFRNSSIRR